MLYAEIAIETIILKRNVKMKYQSIRVRVMSAVGHQELRL